MALRRREPRLGRVWSFILFAALAGCVLLPSCNSTQETDTVTEKPGDTKTRTLIATKVPEPTPRPVDIALPTPTAEPENTQERTPVATRIPRPTPNPTEAPVPRHKTESRDSLVPPPGDVLWRYESEGLVWTRPVVADGMVYLGTRTDYLDREGQVFALDAETGGLAWTYETKGPINTAPVVSNGVVYVHTRITSQYVDHIYALDGATGEELWFHDERFRYSSKVVVSEGIVYMGSKAWRKFFYSTSPTPRERPPGYSMDPALYALEGSTGKLLWRYDTEGYVDSAPVVVDGIVYAISVIDLDSVSDDMTPPDSYLFALEGNTGEIIWEYRMEGGVESSPVVMEKMVYAISRKGQIYGLDRATGELTWQHEIPRGRFASLIPKGLFTPLTVEEGVVYVGTAEETNEEGIGYLYALDGTTGKLLWRSQTWGAVGYISVESEGIVNALSREGYIYAIDEASGEVLWSGGAGGTSFSRPTVTEAVMYVGWGGLAGVYVYARAAESGEILWRSRTDGRARSTVAVEEGVVYAAARRGSIYALATKPESRSSDVVKPDPGVLLWSHRVATGDMRPSSVAIEDGVVYVGSENQRVYALDAITGEAEWQYKTGGLVWHPPAVAEGMAFVGSLDGYVYGLEANTGELLWRSDVGGRVWSPLTVAEGAVYASAFNEETGDGRLNALKSATGEAMWQYKVDGRVQSWPEVLEGMVYASSWDLGKNGYVFALEEKTGELVWKYDTGDSSFATFTISGGIVYGGSRSQKETEPAEYHMYALNVKTGELLWLYTMEESVALPPVVTKGMVYTQTTDGSFYALDATTGKPLWQWYDKQESTLYDYAYGYFYGYALLAHGLLPDVATVSGGVVYLGSPDGHVYALDARTGETLWQYEIGAEILSAPTVVGEVAYVQATDEYLYALDAATGEFLWRYETRDYGLGRAVVIKDVVYLASGSGDVYALVGGKRP